MTDEEKEAVENLKKNFIIMNNGEIYRSSTYIVYNLISKLQKEIEKLKNQNKKSAIEHEKAFNKFDKMIDLMLDDMNLNGNPKQEVYRSYENRAISILKQVEVEDE